MGAGHPEASSVPSHEKETQEARDQSPAGTEERPRLTAHGGPAGVHLAVGDDDRVANVAEAENPRCESCGMHSVFKDGKYGPYFECEASCGWKRNMKAEIKRPPRTKSAGGRLAIPGLRGRDTPAEKNS